MINEIRLKKTVNDILRETFPTAHIYGQGDNEGFEYPAIFSEMAMTNQNDATINIVEKNYKIGIQYVPSGDRSEEDDLTFYQTLRDALCCIDDRNRKRGQRPRLRVRRRGSGPDDHHFHIVLS